MHYEKHHKRIRALSSLARRATIADYVRCPVENPGHLVNYCATRRALKTDRCSPSDFQPQPVSRDMRTLRFSRRPAQFHESKGKTAGRILGLPAHLTHISWIDVEHGHVLDTELLSTQPDSSPGMG